MREIQDRFIEKLRSKVSDKKIEMGLGIYNKLLTEYIIEPRHYNSTTLFSFLNASCKYFDAYLDKDAAQNLKSLVTKEILKLEKQYNKIDVGQLKRLGKFLTNIIYFSYELQHSTVKKRKDENYDLYQLYDEIIKTTSSDSKNIFINFNQLANEVKGFGYCSEDLLNIILYFVKLNLDKFYTSSINPIPDIEKIRNHKFKHISSKKLNRIIESGNIEKFLSDNTKSKKARKEIMEFIEQNPLDIDYVIGNCQLIYDFYKQPSRHSYNSLEFINALTSLGIESEISKKMISSLGKNEKIQQEVTINITRKDSKPILSKKEIYSISKELQEYFDIEQLKLKRTLSLKEIIYCISLLTKISADEKVINDFISLSLKEFRKGHPINAYYELYNKLTFLRDKDNDKYDIGGLLSYIEQDIQSMFICSSEEYEKLKASVSENLKYVLNRIGNNSEYEKQEVEKLNQLIKIG